jgi:hypothetical protein
MKLMQQVTKEGAVVVPVYRVNSVNTDNIFMFIYQVLYVIQSYALRVGVSIKSRPRRIIR